VTIERTPVPIDGEISKERDTQMQVVVVGAGYVGLTTAVCIAHLGHEVHAVDIDAERVERMRRGETPILEEGLAELMHEGLTSGRLHFTTDSAEPCRDADFVFLCVPTPQGADGAADLTFVEQASATIAPHLKEGAVVINKSTVPVGSAEKVMIALGRLDVVVVSNPEFLREGHAIHDWLHPERIVIGSHDRQAAEHLARLYEPLGAPCLITDPASAETVKYACNAFLAAKVSFVNAIARLCEAVGANSVDVIRGMSFDRRIGADHLAPGPGWGGSCFPKDTHALIRIADEHGYDFPLLREVVASNERQFDYVGAQVEAAAGGSLAGAVVGVWGLTFKAGTDDLRDSPALAVIKRLNDRGALVKAFDPTMPLGTDRHFDGLQVTVYGDAYTACEDAEALVVLTDWPEFREMDMAKVASLMFRAAVVDTRNVLNSDDLKGIGFSYRGMGRN
jgi:UDPglucose 6-dehydrogenase